jgi:hypothetical protein
MCEEIAASDETKVIKPAGSGRRPLGGLFRQMEEPLLHTQAFRFGPGP